LVVGQALLEECSLDLLSRERVKPQCRCVDGRRRM
jgi:hypothetical protein